MRLHLTDTAIQKALRDAAASGIRTDISDPTCPGLRIRVTPAGLRKTKDKASWVLACRDREGRMRRFPLGSYPDIGIGEARDAARRTHSTIKTGADPIAERRRHRAMGAAAKLGAGTLAAMLDLYGDKHGPKSWEAARQRIDVVFQPLLKRPLATLQVGDFQMAADAYPFPKSAAFSVRSIRPALKWAAAPGREYLAGDMSRLVSPARVERRDRVLSRLELKLLLPYIAGNKSPFPAAIYFLLLTLARREEVAQAHWRDVDFARRTWTIPDTKNGQPHLVPLSRQAVELLQGMKPSKPNELIFHTKNLKALSNWDRSTKALQTASGTSGWSRHDLRRTGATMLGEMGVMPDIVEAALNHAAIRSTLAATYNRSRYRPQVAEALQKLADVFDEICAEAGQHQAVSE